MRYRKRKVSKKGTHLVKVKQHPIFVYGTLRPGGIYFGHIERYVAYSRPSFLHYAQLYDLGNLPAVKLGSFTYPPVKGDLLFIREEAWDRCISQIDYFENEGYLYHRQLVQALEPEEKLYLWAWAYLIIDYSGCYRRVVSNDWQNRE